MSEQPETPGGETPGGAGILTATKAATAVFLVTSTAGAIWPRGAGVVALVVSVALFVAGCAAFVYAYAVVVNRSRAEVIGVANTFVLTGDTAPRAIKRVLLGALGVQVVVSLAAAIARPFTIAAAGTLVPMFGLGMCGLWASRHGRFPARPASPANRSTRQRRGPAGPRS